MEDLRPLGLGELVDRSAGFWRRNWQPLFRLYLGFQLAQFAFLRGWEAMAKAWFPFLRGGKATAQALQGPPDELVRQLAVAAPATLVMMLGLVLAANVMSVAGSALVVPRLWGQEASVSQALRRCLQTLGPTVGLVALSLLWLLGWGVASALPGLGLLVVGAVAKGPLGVALAALGTGLVLLAFLAVVLAYVLRFATAGPVLAVEEVGAVGAWRRTGALSRGRVGPAVMDLVKLRLTVLVTVVGVIVVVVTLVASAPVLVVQGVYGKIFDPANADPDAIPQLLLLPAQLLQIVLGSLVGPLYPVALSWFYVDLRLRREGLDLERRMEAKPS